MLVAKVLMPVAANMELGRKEAYLEPLNTLLGEARTMMRAYLLSVSEVRQSCRALFFPLDPAFMPCGVYRTHMASCNSPK